MLKHFEQSLDLIPSLKPVAKEYTVVLDLEKVGSLVSALEVKTAGKMFGLH
jgi:hypothetical protein